MVEVHDARHQLAAVGPGRRAMSGRAGGRGGGALPVPSPGLHGLPPEVLQWHEYAAPRAAGRRPNLSHLLGETLVKAPRHPKLAKLRIPHHPIEPGPPLKGPTTSLVIQPP